MSHLLFQFSSETKTRSGSSDQLKLQFLPKTPLVIITAAPQQARPCPSCPPVLHQSCPKLTFSLISLIRGISQRQEGVKEGRGGRTRNEQLKGKRWMKESPYGCAHFISSSSSLTAASVSCHWCLSLLPGATLELWWTIAAHPDTYNEIHMGSEPLTCLIWMSFYREQYLEMLPIIKLRWCWLPLWV